MGIYGGHGIFGHLPGHPQDLKQYKTHPAVEAQLLDPNNAIWRSGNLFLRLFPENLFPCVGARMVLSMDAAASPRRREQARKELAGLERCIRKYFKRTGRPAGRPPKLNAADRAALPSEHVKLSKLIRQHSGVMKDELADVDTLNQLFHTETFVSDLFRDFPLRQTAPEAAWKKFLEETSTLGVSDRCLHYLSLRHGVSHHTIHRSIWPTKAKT